MKILDPIIRFVLASLQVLVVTAVCAMWVFVILKALGAHPEAYL